MTRTDLLSNLRRGALLTALVLGFAGAAEARDETVRWTHPTAAEVASFHLQVGTAPGVADLIDQTIGVPSQDAQGIFSYTLTVDTDETIYVRMTAVDAQSVHSDPSNTISRSVPLGMPGQPVVEVP